MTDEQIENLNRYLIGSLSILQSTYDMLEQQKYVFEEGLIGTEETATEEFIDGVNTMDLDCVIVLKGDYNGKIRLG